MRRFFKNFNLIVPQIQNSLLPALIFACAFLGYFFYGEISPLARHNLHLIFWFSNALCLAVLIYFNRNKPFFFLLCIALSYMIINWLKHNYSLDYLSTSAYINLCFFIPINLGIFYYLPPQKLISTKTLWIMTAVFLQLALGEYLERIGFMISFNTIADSINLNSLSVLLFLIILVSAFIRCSFTGHIEDTTLFFSMINIFAGFYFSSSSTALCIFFSAAALTAVLGTIKNINYTLGNDFLTGLASRHAYMKDAKKFPLKYSLAIVCIDNYPHLLKIIGTTKMQKLIKMLAIRLGELEPDNPLYRYSTDEFIIVFKNDNLKQSFEKLDAIRREIAASEFMFSPKQKGLKITISGCVSEKKRSDANATEVMVRAHRTLQKTYQFTQNLISKA